MRVLCRAYDIDAPGGSGAWMRVLADTLRARGAEVWATAESIDERDVAAWNPDVIVGQQWATAEATRWATSLRRPFVMVVHGAGQYEAFMPQCDLVVCANPSLQEELRPQLGGTPSLVCGADQELELLSARLEAVAAAGRRRPTLTLCMTVANEGATVERAIDSVAGVVDEIVIGVDVRSSDETLAIARRRATRVFEFDESQPPDFPRMRNRALALAETDWVIVVDGHEWIDHAHLIREALETDAWSIEIQTLFEPDEQRVPALAFLFPRIHRRHVRFAGAAAHEEVTTPLERRDARADIQVWHERKPGVAADARNAEKSGRELVHLREAWEQRGDRRALFYLANGLRESGRHDEAIAAYTSYLEAPNFAEEAWHARLYRARCHAAREDHAAAIVDFTAAITTAPQRAEAVVGLGYACLAMGDSARAAAWFRMATALPQPRDCRLFVEVPVYRWGAWHGLALALDAAGDAAGAADAAAHAAAGGAGPWAARNLAWWRERAGSTVR